MTVTREDALEVQAALLELERAGAEMRLKDGRPSLTWKPPAWCLESLKKHRELLVVSLSRLHACDTDSPTPEASEPVEALTSEWATWRTEGENLTEGRWLRWRYRGTRLWFHANGELWLDPILVAEEPEHEPEERGWKPKDSPRRSR